ncbi:tRNA (32-2'-O)-methyltransferase regulator THADA isoform X1 [Petromyzon marinus]|uniref:tRNA (32-2'-O)-methyltransferase regulator THADA isoform X1 n=2 Tax=Petromyzon marinus TaxID=7757 RepID=UPI003F70DB77
MGRRRRGGAADVGAIEIGARELELLATLADGAAGDGEAARAVLDCVQLADGMAQLAQLKKVGAALQRASERASRTAKGDPPAGAESHVAREVACCCLRVLTLAHLTVSWKSPLKRALASLLESQRGEWRVMACDALAGQVSDAVGPSGRKPGGEPSPADASRPGWVTVSTLACCLENFPLGEEALVSVLSPVLELLLGLLSDSVNRARECAGKAAERTAWMHEAQTAVKTTMVLLQKGLGRPGKAQDEGPMSLRTTSAGFIGCFVDILSDAGFLRTCRAAAGMAAVLLLLLGPNTATDPAPLLALALLGSREMGASGGGGGEVALPAWASEGFRRLCDVAASDREAWLSVCHGTLAMLDWDVASGPQLRLLLRVLQPLLGLAAGSQEPSAALTLARTLTLWTTSALVALGSEAARATPLLCSALTGSGRCDEFTSPSPTPCDSSPLPPTSMPASGSSSSSPPSAEVRVADLLVERYVWANLDHPLDGVRHEARHILTNLLRAHCAAVALARTSTFGSGVGGDAAASPVDGLARGVARRTLALGWRCRAAFGAARALIEVQGPSWLLALAPGTPRGLLVAAAVDPAMCPHAADVLGSMSRAHFQEIGHGAESRERQDVDGVGIGGDFADPWLRTWVSPLLEVLYAPPLGTGTADEGDGAEGDGAEGDADAETGRSRVVEQCLPQLLQSNPACLALTVQALQARQPGGRGSLGGLVACVRASARVRGAGPGHPDGDARAAAPDRLLLGEDLMERALAHRSDQVRLDALALLCESVRGTEPVSPRELALLRTALPLALPGCSAATRRATLSLVRKLLLRMRDGALAWLRQSGSSHRSDPPGVDGRRPHVSLQQYGEFLVWLSDMSFDALFPGASFPRKFMALSMLGLLEEVFPDFPGFSLAEAVTPERARVLLGCLADNFPEVKRLASALLRLLPGERLGLQTEECLRSLLGVALALASSPRPSDPSTAAPLLALLVRWAPHAALSRVLPSHTSEDGVEETCPGGRGVGEVTGADPVSSASRLDGVQDKTDRSLESNTLAVMGVLVSGLEADVAVAEHSLLEAAGTRPMYGRLHAAAHLLHGTCPGSLCAEPAWQHLLERLLSAAWRVSRIASRVVNSSSPEGFIPDRPGTGAGCVAAVEEEREGTRSVTAQAVLLCCWRSMKEISLLLGQLSQHAALQPAQMEAVGHYFRQQLLESRHRGAFELAYVGFGKLVDALARSEDPALQALPRQWLEAVLGEVKESAAASKLCATRRSAGVPFYIQALVSAEHKRSGRSLLRTAMTQLLPLALPQGKGPDEPSVHAQVHALNILRALFRDSRLGDHMTTYVPDALRAAILGFASPVWAVCNSCTLLFSTLITRVFGAKRSRREPIGSNRMTGREFFSRYPSLHPFLLEQLSHAASTCSRSGGDAVGTASLQPALFPLLLLLAKLYPSPMDGTYTELSLAPFLPLLVRCGGSPVWRARVMAAHALVAFIPAAAATRVLCELLDSLPRGLRQADGASNRTHGTLLQVHHLVRAQGESLGSSPEFVPRSGYPGERVYERLLDCVWLATRMNPCAVTRAAYLDVLSLAITHGERSCRKGAVYATLVLRTHALVSAWLQAPSDGQVLEPGHALWEASSAHLALALLSAQPPYQRQGASGTESRTADDAAGDERGLLRRLLSSPACEVHSAALCWLVAARASEHRRGQPQGTQLGGTEVMEAVRDLAVQEMHPQCRTEAFRALCRWPVEDLVPWPQGIGCLAADELLNWIVALIEANLHNVDLRCAGLEFSARVVQHLLNLNPMQQVPPAWARCVERWIRSVVAGGNADTRSEVRLVSAEVIGEVAASLLTNDRLPMGLGGCLNLWGALLGLLQDDDVGVRARATTALGGLAPRSPTWEGVALEEVMPNHALDLGLKALLDLLGAWGLFWEALPTLLLWLLEDEEPRVVGTTEDDEQGGLGHPAELLMEAGEERENENEFLFDKGRVNLFAERLLFARLLCARLEGHLRHLFTHQPAPPNPDVAERLAATADALAASSRKATRDLLQLRRSLEPSLQEAPRYTVLAERAARCVLTLRVLLLAVAPSEPAPALQAAVQAGLQEARALERACSGTGLTHSFLACTAGIHQGYALNPERSCS